MHHTIGERVRITKLESNKPGFKTWDAYYRPLLFITRRNLLILNTSKENGSLAGIPLALPRKLLRTDKRHSQAVLLHKGMIMHAQQ